MNVSNNAKFFIFTLVLALIFFASTTDAGQKKSILILNSYHQGYKWTDDETRGALDGFGAFRDDSKIYIEYMGTKWAYDQRYFEQLRNTYKHKFKNIKFDVIIVTDSDAFNFLQRYRDELFATTPVVFCGVNWFAPEAVKAGFTGYTGVNEDADIKMTIDLMLQLHPQTKRIYVVIDSTTTGLAVHEKMQELIPLYQGRVLFSLLENLAMDTILNTVSHAPADSLVLVTVFQQDKVGAFFEFSESTSLISKNSSVPLYGLWDFNLGFGIVGGMLTSGYSQGKSAGEAALRILQGEKPDAVPVLMKSPNRYMFDYAQLQRWNIGRSALPVNSVVINEPVSFYALHKSLVWGTLGGFVGLFTIIVLLLINIRVRRQGEEALRQSEKQYRTLVNNVNIGVYRNTAGPHGSFLQANPALARIFGYESPDELLNMAVSELYQNPEDRKLYLEDMRQNGFVKDKVLAMKKKDGTPIWCSVTATAQFDESGNIKYMDSVLEDITEQKRLEEQLRQSQKMEAIGNLAGGVAHDFNNILTAITGYGSLLRLRIGEGSPFKSYADEILAASERATHLTQSLLAFSRKQVLAPKPENLNEIVTRIEKLLVRVIGEDIEFKIELCERDLIVLADSSQIEQVLMNLATNARDAMQNGGLLTIKTERVDITGPHGYMKPGEYAVLSVSDTGKGMDEQTKLRIFEPFFTTKEKGKGTGLGLSIVYGIVKQHGGDINVYSEPGKGTTFRLYFKLVDMKVENVVAAPLVTPQGGTETILLAEDDAEVRRLMKNILQEYGYTVIAAVDGEDAVIKFIEHKDQINLLLFDVVMPKKNGKEAYEEIRRMKQDVLVLFASGYTADIIHKKGLLEQGLNFISKPVTPNLLLAKIREILDT